MRAISDNGQSLFPTLSNAAQICFTDPPYLEWLGEGGARIALMKYMLSNLTLIHIDYLYTIRCIRICFQGEKDMEISVGG